MKNYPYNTGRTVTISLDTLGNAAIWQLFQILTDGTNNICQGDEPDASPAADSDAATEIFLHIAETADDRADGADAGQRDFLLGTKEEYLDIFEDGDGPANIPANEAPANEEPANEINANEERRRSRAYDAVETYLGCPEHDFLRKILEEAADTVKEDPMNLFKAGNFEGAARMLAAAIMNDGDDGGEGLASLTAGAYDYCMLPW